MGLPHPDPLVRVGGRGVDVTAVPGVVPPMYEAEDGPVSEGLGLEAQVVSQVLRGEVDPPLPVHNKDKPVQRFQHQRTWKKNMS